MVIDEKPDHGAMVHQQAQLGQGTPTELGHLADAVNFCIQRQLCSGRSEHNIVDEIGQRLIGQHGQRDVRQDIEGPGVGNPTLVSAIEQSARISSIIPALR